MPPTDPPNQNPPSPPAAGDPTDRGAAPETDVRRSNPRLRTAASVCALLLVMAGELGAARAADAPSVSTRVDRERVEVGAGLRLSVRASASGRAPIRVSGDLASSGFRTVGRARAPQLTIRNGRTYRTLRLTFRLRAEEVGEHRLDPPDLSVGDRTLDPDPVTVEVVESTGTSPSPRQRSERKSSERDGNEQDAVFVRTERPGDDAPFVGEQFELTFRLLHDPRQLDIEPRPPSVPSFDDFWVEDLSRTRAGDTKMEVVDGRAMESTVLRSYVLFPLQKGRASIEPLTLEIRTGGFFSRSETRELAADPIEVDVRPLPTPKPDGFRRGNVGQWRLSASLEDRDPAVGQGATLTLSTRGTGNVRQLTLPSVPEVDGLTVQGGDTETESRVRDGRAGGRRVRRYTLVPEESGRLEIPEISFHTFDPEDEVYRTQRAGPFALDVQPAPEGARAARSAVDGGGTGAEPPVAGDRSAPSPSTRRDLLARMPGPVDEVGSETADRPVWSRTPVWLAAGAPLLGLLALFVWPAWRRSRSRDRDPDPALERAAQSVRAPGEVAADEAPERIAAASRAMATFGRTDAPEEPSPSALRRRLTDAGLDADVADGAADALEWAERLQYAPGLEPDPEEAARQLERCRRAVRRLRDGPEDPESGPAATSLLLVAGPLATSLAVAPLALEAGEPDSEERASVESALAAHRAGDWSRAARQWRSLADERPDWSIWLNLGTSRAHAGDHGRARAALERAARAAPDRPEPRRALDVLQQIVALERREADDGRARPSVAPSRALSSSLVRIDPDHLASAAIIGLWLFFLGAAGFRASRARRGWWASVSALGLGAATLVATVGLTALRSAGGPPSPTVVVLEERPTLRTGPSSHAPTVDRAGLVPGMGGRAVDRRRGWIQTAFPAGPSGWLPRESVDVVQSAESDPPDAESNSTSPSPTADNP